MERLGPLQVAEAGGVQQVVELHAVPMDRGHVLGQLPAVHRGAHVGGAAAADDVVGQLAVDFVDVVLLELGEQIEVVIGCKCESHAVCASVRRDRRLCRTTPALQVAEVEAERTTGG